MNSYGEPLMGGAQQVKIFNDLVFGSVLEGQEPPQSPPLRRTSQPPVEVQWGSDTRFNRATSYVPDSARETYDALEAVQLSYMACIEPSKSAATTRPSSPNGESSSTARPPVRNGVNPDTTENDADAPPRKRRKSRNGKEDAEEEDDSTAESTGKGSKKRKGKADGPGAPGENGTSGKRRKSGTGAKAARENLSEAQKRENHIRSEQKRRTLIKEGFDDLCELVPGLKGGGFSKSTMLTMAAEWLEDMLKGNQQLTSQLAALEGR